MWNFLEENYHITVFNNDPVHFMLVCGIYEHIDNKTLVSDTFTDFE